MAQTLKVIPIASDVWAQIRTQLPSMEYQIPGTGKNAEKFIHPSFNLYVDESQPTACFMAVEMEITIKQKASFFTYALIAKDELKEMIANNALIPQKQEVFINYVTNNLSGEIQTNFETLCKQTPWALIYKLTNVLGKLTDGRVYEFQKEVGAHNWLATTTNLSAEATNDIFWFSHKHFSGKMSQPEGTRLSSSVLYLAHGIVSRATRGLSLEGYIMYNTSEQKQKEFMTHFRTFIREVVILAYYHLKMENEKSFNENYSDWGRVHIGPKEWKYMEKQFNHFWENGYTEKLQTVVKLYNNMTAIIDEIGSH